VIPTLNEADNIGRLLGEIDRECEPHEVIVVDGGSADDSVALSEAAAACVLHSAANRGAQLAAGAAAASGEILLFLHADSRLGPGGLSAIARALGDRPDLVGGNFRMLFVVDNRFNRWLTGFCAWIRTRGYYYGDSGIFVRRDIYNRLGGIFCGWVWIHALYALGVSPERLARLYRSGDHAPSRRSSSRR
jgi:glycosyltransferase involved in cell wall biosynthesis